jgi:hypothetical protein
MWSAKLTGKSISTARPLLDYETIFSRVLLLSQGVLCWNLVRTPDGLDRRMVGLIKGTKNWTQKSENCLIKGAGDSAMTGDVFRAHEKISWIIS